MEGVGGQVDIDQLMGLAQRAAAAVGAGEGAEVGDLVAVGQGLIVGGFGDGDGGDVLVGQRGEFAGLADAVLVHKGGFTFQPHHVQPHERPHGAFGS